jgi:HEAT repeat protein
VAAFGRLSHDKAGPRTRYLLLDVAAGLAEKDASARRYLQTAMTRDPDGHVRAQAVRVAAKPGLFSTELLAALDDREMRVRQAALEALRSPAARFAGDAMTRRLAEDPWPMVRAEAARALGAQGPDARIDDALAGALDDASPAVVVPVLLALGTRGALRHAEVIRERVSDEDAAVLVRAASASALGLMCDTESVDLLTGYAQRLKDPMLDPGLRVIGAAALGALGRLGPRDLAQRLAPLKSAKAPRAVRDAADSASKQRNVCVARPRS